MKNVTYSKDINWVWENITASIKILTKENVGLYEWKQHKPWLYDGRSQFLGQAKGAKNAVVTRSKPKRYR